MNNQIAKNQLQLFKDFEENLKLLHQTPEGKLYQKTSQSLLQNKDKKNFYLNTLDPRFNSYHWALDVTTFFEQIPFGLCWMKTYGTQVEKDLKADPRPYGTNPMVAYFGDNCAIGINSCRDKIALMLWAYHCSFDPTKEEEVLAYKDISKRIRFPTKFALKIKEDPEFLTILDRMGSEEFKIIQKYRHQKTHRMDPKIIMEKVGNHHYRDYRFPIITRNERRSWEDSLPVSSPEYRETREKGSTYDGVQYQAKRLEETLYEYSKMLETINACMMVLFKTVGEAFKVLDKRLFADNPNFKPNS